MGEISRRSFLKISGATAASTALVPFGSKWVEAFLKDFSGMPLQKDMTDEQFIKYIEGVLKKHEDVVGTSVRIETLNDPFSFGKTIRGLVVKGNKANYWKFPHSDDVKAKYWSFKFMEEAKHDVDLRKAMAKNMILAISLAWKGKHPVTPIDINYVV